MIGKKFLIKSIDSCIYGGRLDQDIIAIGIILQHSYDSPDLAFDSLQTVDQLLSLGIGTIRVLGTAAGTDFFLGI